MRPLDDGRHELEEDVVLTLVAGPGYTLGYPATASVLVSSDDLHTITVQAIDPYAVEDIGDTLTFVVTRSDDPVDQVTVYLDWGGTARPGRDYWSAPNYVTFMEGVSSVAVEVTALDDQYDDPDESVVLTLIPDPWVPAPTYLIGANATAQGTILTDPGDTVAHVTVEVTDPDASEADPNDTIILTFHRTGSTAQDLWVRYVVTGTAVLVEDYEPFWPIPGQGQAVKIPAGSATATVSIRAVNDLIDEPGETVTVTFIDCDVFDYDYAWVRTGFPVPPGSSATGVIHSDADPYPIIVIAATDPDAVDLSLDPGLFTVSREGGDWSQPLTVTFDRSGTLDFSLHRLLDANGNPISSFWPFSVTIPAGLGSTTITLDAFGDIPDEADHKTAILTLTGAPGYQVSADQGVAVVQVENPILKIDPVSTGTFLGATSPINSIPNPAAIVIERKPSDANVATLRITHANFAVELDDPRVTWEVVSLAGAQVQFFQGDNKGSQVKVYGTGNVEGRISIDLKLNGADIGPVVEPDYEAYVVWNRYMPVRINLLSGTTPGVGSSSTPAQAADHLKIANVYLRQIGVTLHPRGGTPTDGAVPAPGLLGFFTVQVPDAFTRRVRFEDFGSLIQVNHLKKVVQVDYVESLKREDALGVAAAFPKNANGEQVSLRYKITVDENAAVHRMGLRPAELPAGPSNWGILVTNSPGNPVTNAQEYGNLLAHELGHVMNLGHRGLESLLELDPIYDGLDRPDENLMQLSEAPPVAEDLDLIQLVGARGSKTLLGQA